MNTATSPRQHGAAVAHTQSHQIGETDAAVTQWHLYNSQPCSPQPTPWRLVAAAAKHCACQATRCSQTPSAGRYGRVRLPPAADAMLQRGRCHLCPHAAGAAHQHTAVLGRGMKPCSLAQSDCGAQLGIPHLQPGQHTTQFCVIAATHTAR